MAFLARAPVLGKTASFNDPAECTTFPRKAPDRTFLSARRSQPRNSTSYAEEDLPDGIPSNNAQDVEAAVKDQEAEEQQPEGRSFAARVRFGINASWAVNILLLI